MRIYRLEATLDSQRLACRVEGEYERVAELRGRPVAQGEWAPLAVEIIRDGSAGRAPSDLMMLGMEPALTPRAVAALGPLVSEYGQLLPLLSADGEFHLWNVTRIVDALDEPPCTLMRFSTGRIMTVDRWAFAASALAQVAAFKVPQFPRGFTFVADAFVDAVAEASLTGFALEPVWAQLEAPEAAI